MLTLHALRTGLCVTASREEGHWFLWVLLGKGGVQTPSVQARPKQGVCMSDPIKELSLLALLSSYFQQVPLDLDY